MKIRFFPTYIIFFIILALSVGYAAFGSKLSISNIVAEVRIKADIRVTNFIYTEGTNGGLSTYDNYNVDSLLTTINLPSANSTATYKVKITNIGNAEMGIYALNNLPSNLTYSITNYTLKDKLCDSNNKCSNGSVKEFYITIKYTDTGYDSANTEYNLNLGVDFRQFYTITYEDITNNGYPTEIIDGGNLSFTFTDPIPEKITVYLDDAKVDTSLYTYTNNVFTFNNVTGNITIGPSKSTLYDTIKLATNGLDTNIDFSLAPSSTNGDGVNTLSGTENDEYPVYYYRGAVTNNNVLFANFCWKAVRTTSTGGVKLIYNGAPADNGSCNNTGDNSHIGISVFNLDGTSPADVGYMYGTRYIATGKSFASMSYLTFGNDVEYSDGVYTLKDTYTCSSFSNCYSTVNEKYHYTCLNSKNTCNTVYYTFLSNTTIGAWYLTLTGGKDIENAKTEMFTNTTDSKIKKVVDSWYEANMTLYTNLLEDTPWCNDRSLYSGGLKGKDEDGSSNSYSGAYARNIVNYKPTVSCPQINDSFTVSEENGNGALTYPVGLLTSDESLLAGHGSKSYSTSSFLYNGLNQWSMSPIGFSTGAAAEFKISSASRLMANSVASEISIRPSISISNKTTLEGGNGSTATPYIIE